MKTINLLLLILISTIFISCASTTDTAEAPATPGTECVSGTTKTGFLTAIVSGNAPCSTGMRTCVNGYWVGPQLYDSCTNPNKGSANSP